MGIDPSSHPASRHSSVYLPVPLPSSLSLTRCRPSSAHPPSICRPPTCALTYPAHPAVFPSTYSPISRPVTHHPSHSSMHPNTTVSFHPPPIHLAVHLSAHLPARPPVHLFIQPLSHPPKSLNYFLSAEPVHLPGYHPSARPPISPVSSSSP